MLKKTITTMITCLTLVAALLGLLNVRQNCQAEVIGPTAQIIDLDGMIISVTPDSDTFLMRSSDGLILMVHAGGMTDGLQAGDAVRVRYNGVMSRSIPSQIYAQVVLSNRMSAVVTDVNENGLTIQTDDGTVLTAVTDLQARTGDTVTVWLAGETVLLVRGVTVQGIVSGIDDNDILLDTENGTIILHSTETTIVLTTPEVGQPLTAACISGPDADGSYTAAQIYAERAAE